MLWVAAWCEGCMHIKLAACSTCCRSGIPTQLEEPRLYGIAVPPERCLCNVKEAAYWRACKGGAACLAVQIGIWVRCLRAHLALKSRCSFVLAIKYIPILFSSFSQLFMRHQKPSCSTELLRELIMGSAVDNRSFVVCGFGVTLCGVLLSCKRGGRPVLRPGPARHCMPR